MYQRIFKIKMKLERAGEIEIKSEEDDSEQKKRKKENT